MPSLHARPTAHAGFIALGTLTVSALSSLVLMSACRSVDDVEDRGAAAALRCPSACQIEAMPHLAAFEEHFVVGAPDE